MMTVVATASISPSRIRTALYNREGSEHSKQGQVRRVMKRVVLVAGVESFNADLYRQAAEMAQERCDGLEVLVVSDRDLAAQPDTVAQALAQADVFFGSLLFDYDQVLWPSNI